MPDISFAPQLNPFGSPDQPFSDFSVVPEASMLSTVTPMQFATFKAPPPFAPSSSAQLSAAYEQYPWAFSSAGPAVFAGSSAMAFTGNPLFGLAVGLATYGALNAPSLGGSLPDQITTPQPLMNFGGSQ